MLNSGESGFYLPHIILASGSPRRAEILDSVGWPFEKDVPNVDESIVPGEAPEDYVVRLAVAKAEKIASVRPDAVVLGADTTVVIDDEIIGKPVDEDDARQMIARLSGRWHSVITGVAVVSEGRTTTAFQNTGVKFVELSSAEVDFLTDRGEPLDKAGGYAVQAQAALFIEAIDGDHWNVVGLPISLVYKMVRKVLKAEGRSAPR